MRFLCLPPILFFAFWVSSAQATCPSVATATRFTLNGAEVTDKITGLVWTRCSVGQTWTGSTCSGTASTFTHEQALQHAQAQSGWRLPNVKELSSLPDRGCAPISIDAVAFPSTPGGLYWSSSPVAGDATSAWVVDFGNGYVGSGSRSSNYHVRLVRASQ